MFCQRLQCRQAILALGDHVELGPELGEQGAQLLPLRQLVLGDQRGGAAHGLRGSSGTTSRAITPPKARSCNSSCAAVPKRVISCARILASPVPSPRPTSSPAPSSSTTTSSLPPSIRAPSTTRVPPGLGSAPCLMAFSTSEISSSGGNGSSRSSGGSRSSYCRRSPSRTFM